jgi:hypothetical protein
MTDMLRHYYFSSLQIFGKAIIISPFLGTPIASGLFLSFIQEPYHIAGTYLTFMTIIAN